MLSHADFYRFMPINGLILITSLQGTTITLTTKTGQRYEGVIGSTGGEGDAAGVTLKDVKDISTPGQPLKELFFVATTNSDMDVGGGGLITIKSVS